MYVEPWHADIEAFLDLKKNHGKQEARARDLFFSLWIADLFMRRVESDGEWTLMCPYECPGLTTVYGAAFDALYEQYEAQGKGRAHGRAEVLNLCAEILEFVAPVEVAVCNLASIALPKFVHEGKFYFDELRRVTGVVTRNLNRVIDVNYYPVPAAKRSNFRHRPIGIGVQGLAVTFALLRLPFDSEKARTLNAAIFENMYYGAMEASCALAERNGAYGPPHDDTSLHGPYRSYGDLSEKTHAAGEKNLIEFAQSIRATSRG
ncbi:hypothetical protein T492DRAFT_832164 [Pavlovales sp. CCMP2436]|nr:hypothetical protein T492DRAFT_832164 [Pavlovales sp. CCMP2436]